MNSSVRSPLYYTTLFVLTAHLGYWQLEYMYTRGRFTIYTSTDMINQLETARGDLESVQKSHIGSASNRDHVRAIGHRSRAF